MKLHNLQVALCIQHLRKRRALSEEQDPVHSMKHHVGTCIVPLGQEAQPSHATGACIRESFSMSIWAASHLEDVRLLADTNLAPDS